MKFKKILLVLGLVSLMLCSCAVKKKEPSVLKPSDNDDANDLPSRDDDVVVPPTPSGDDNIDNNDDGSTGVDPSKPTEEVKEYKVVYYNEDGTINSNIPTVVVKEKTTYVIDKTITTSKTGDENLTYDFIGWSTTKGDTRAKESIVVTQDVRLYPVFKSHPTYVTLKIVYSDNSLLPNEAERKIKYGTKFNPSDNEPPQSATEKIRLEGWYLDENYTNKITETIVIKENTIIYGKISVVHATKSDTLYYSADGTTFLTEIPNAYRPVPFVDNNKKTVYAENGYYEFLEPVKMQKNPSYDLFGSGTKKTLSELNTDFYTALPSTFESEKLNVITPKTAQVYVRDVIEFAEGDIYIACLLSGVRYFEYKVNVSSADEVRNNLAFYCEKVKEYVQQCSILTKDGVTVLDDSLLVNARVSGTTYYEYIGDVNVFTKKDRYETYKLIYEEVYYYIYEYYEYKEE